MEYPFGVEKAIESHSLPEPGLNPCFSGISFRSNHVMLFVRSEEGLNPCFSGISFRSCSTASGGFYLAKVLILVLVEYPFEDLVDCLTILK